ncbi:MAG: DUF2344 domain-containing protein [Chloroflexi bacterium]|nr:DUF2344 domain-containing protein [Chloroflexota bacterium]
MQRLRVRFSRGDPVKFISHLDIIRLWQRAFQRANIPLAYSEGFNPHPRIALAVPLAVGVTSEAELMDVFCDRYVSPQWFMAAVNQQLPPGISILQVYQVPLTLPSLQSQAHFAEYQVKVETDKTPAEIESAIVNILAMATLPWQHQRDTGIRNYDLRALIDSLWLIGDRVVGMRLRCDSIGSGRPEQVMAALGLADAPLEIHRIKLILQIGKQIERVLSI